MRCKCCGNDEGRTVWAGGLDDRGLGLLDNLCPDCGTWAFFYVQRLRDYRYYEGVQWQQFHSVNTKEKIF